MKKKILALLLCVIMVVGLMPTVSFAAESSIDWEADEITISTLEEMITFAEYVNSNHPMSGQTVTLAADIDMSELDVWTPIGTVIWYPSSGFAGTFEGGNHVISHMNAVDDTENYAAAGLFGAITGKIHNVTVTDSTVTSTHWAGGICAYSSSNVGMEITGCKVTNTTIVTAPELLDDAYDNGDKAGGIIGYCVDGDKVLNCSVENVTVQAYRDLGAVIGHRNGNVVVTGCTATNCTVIQDNTNGYKDEVTTYGELVGRNTGDALDESNVATNVTVRRTPIVATIDDLEFVSLAEAVEAAEDGDVIVLTSDAVAGNKAKPSNLWIAKDIVLDLNKNELSGDYQIAIGIDGGADVTIKNGSIIGGTVAAVYAKSGDVTLENVEIEGAVDFYGDVLEIDTANIHYTGTRAAIELVCSGADISKANITGNSGIWDFSANCAVNVRNSNIEVDGWAVYHNGSYEGFEFTGENSTFKAEEAQAFYISGSTITTEANGGKNQQLSLNNCTVSGTTGIEGKFTDMLLVDCRVSATVATPSFEQYNNGSTTDGFAVVSTDNTMSPESPAPSATIRVESGEYVGAMGLSQLVSIDTYPDFVEATYIINGGYFTVDPSAYLDAEHSVVLSDKAGFNYMVIEGTEVEEIVVLPAVGETATEISDAIDAENVGTVTEIAGAVSGDLTEVSHEANQGVHNDIHDEENTDMTVDALISDEKLSDLQGLDAVADDLAKDDVKLFTQAFLSVKAEEYITPAAAAEAGTVPTLVLEITPMAQVVASTAATAENVKTSGVGQNAVVVQAPEKITVETPVLLSIPLPDGFPTEGLVIKHTKDNGSIEYYAYEIQTAGGHNVAVFTTNGFSPFEITAAAASIETETGTVYYDTLAAAVSNVQNGQTIKLNNANSEVVTVSRAVSFTFDVNGNDMSGEVKAGAGYHRSISGNLYTFAANAPVGDFGVSKPAIKPETKPEQKFTDVPADAFYADAVVWAIENGITDGIDDTHFSPETGCTRAQVVTFLWRAAGCPDVVGKTFMDVEKDSYYEKAVAWAVANGITDGIGNNTFAPDAVCTRAQVVAFLYRYNGNGSLNLKENPFTDVNESAYYLNSVLWALENGITDGTSNSTFSPETTCTRAQVVTFLYRSCTK